jgi:NDP-sugar pyrophosphorylase family protein
MAEFEAGARSARQLMNGAPRALLLTAGLGTRLRPLTYLRAKAAVPINGRTLVARAIDWLARAGIRDLVLNLHHRPETIAAVVGDGSDFGVRVRYSWEQPVLGSGGGPRRALPLLVDGRGEDDDFVIVNADTLTDLDLRAIVERHKSSGALVTMALIENPRPEQYGGVHVSSDGWVTSFSPARAWAESRRPNFHFIGVQVARAAAFADLADGVPAESVNALYPRLIAANPRAVAAYISPASFLDIGTPRDCLDTSVSLARAEGPRLIGERVYIHPSARLANTVVWDDVVIGAGASLRDCIVGDGAMIPEGSTFERCAIVPANGRAPQTGERIDGKLLVKELR